MRAAWSSTGVTVRAVSSSTGATVRAVSSSTGVTVRAAWSSTGAAVRAAWSTTGFAVFAAVSSTGAAVRAAWSTTGFAVLRRGLEHRRRGLARLLGDACHRLGRRLDGRRRRLHHGLDVALPPAYRLGRLHRRRLVTALHLTRLDGLRDRLGGLRDRLDGLCHGLDRLRHRLGHRCDRIGHGRHGLLERTPQAGVGGGRRRERARGNDATARRRRARHDARIPLPPCPQVGIPAMDRKGNGTKGQISGRSVRAHELAANPPRSARAGRTARTTPA